MVLVVMSAFRQHGAVADIEFDVWLGDDFHLGRGLRRVAVTGDGALALRLRIRSPSMVTPR